MGKNLSLKVWKFMYVTVRMLKLGNTFTFEQLGHFYEEEHPDHQYPNTS